MGGRLRRGAVGLASPLSFWRLGGLVLRSRSAGVENAWRRDVRWLRCVRQRRGAGGGDVDLELGRRVGVGSERAEVLLVVEVAEDAVWIDVAHLDWGGGSEPELCPCQVLERVEMLWERVIVYTLEAALCGSGEEDDGGRGGMCGSR